MKGSKSNLSQYIPAIVLLLGLGLLALSYFKGYNEFNSKKEDIKSDIEVLQKEFDNLDKLYRNKKTFESRIEENNKRYTEILSDYDASVTDESVLMDLYNAQEEYKLNVLGISLGKETSVYSFGQLTSQNPNNQVASGVNASYAGILKEYSVELNGKYEDVKEFIDNLQNTEGKRRVPKSMSFTIDENGIIGLTMDVSEYAISGEDLEASDVVIPNTENGAENIFSDDFKEVLQQ